MLIMLLCLFFYSCADMPFYKVGVKNYPIKCNAGNMLYCLKQGEIEEKKGNTINAMSFYKKACDSEHYYKKESCDAIQRLHLKNEAREICKEKRKRISRSGWELKNYIDNFGDNTSSKYIVNTKTKGIFSNSATSNSKLGVYIFVKNHKSNSIRLFEYDGHTPKKDILKEFPKWSIDVKDDKNQVYALHGWQGPQDIYLQDKDGSSSNFHILMAKNKSLKIRMKSKSSYSQHESYSFTLYPRKYCSAFNALLPDDKKPASTE